MTRSVLVLLMVLTAASTDAQAPPDSLSTRPRPGRALGEMAYRASAVLRGSESLPRWFRSSVATVADPIGAIHRWSGDTHASVRENPLPGADIWTSARLSWRTGGEDSLVEPDETSGLYYELDFLASTSLVKLFVQIR